MGEFRNEPSLLLIRFESLQIRCYLRSIMKIEEVKLGDLKTGDQIAVKGNVENLSPCLILVTAHSNGTYLHHGIFNKEELCTYELQGDTKKEARPKKRDFTEFYAGHTALYRVEYDEGECLPVDETIKRAEEVVKQGSHWPEYHLILNNCESFATYLKTGKEISMQVLNALVEMAVKVATVVGESSIAHSASIMKSKRF